jgi:hypothetical protein
MILDSGAFSVWTKGAAVDLEAYISFCKQHPDTTYYVNLDVIPGKANDKRSLRRRHGDNPIEIACQRGWDNWKRMSEELPVQKIIPVFHQNDSVRWLEAYLNEGVEYIGISPANDCTTTQKRKWLRSIKQYLFDSAGRPLVRTHGFAVTSYRLLEFWDWYSVDSASWKLCGAWGGIYVPVAKDSEFDYTQGPWQFSVSPMSPNRSKFQFHYDSATKSVKEWIERFVESTGVPFGSYDLKTVKDNYKLNRDEDEIWYDKQKKIVLVPTEKGITTSVEERLRVNAAFIKRATKAIPTVKYIYFAGALMPYPLEFQLGSRLLSFETLKGKSARAAYQRHMDLIRERKSNASKQG